MKSFALVILGLLIFASCNAPLNQTHIINTYHDLSATATVLKEYNDDKIGLLKIELVNSRSHLEPLYLFVKKSDEILKTLDTIVYNRLDAFSVETQILSNQNQIHTIKKTPFSENQKTEFCKILARTSYQIDSLINALFSVNHKGVFLAKEDSILLKKSLPRMFQINWLKQLNQPLEEVLFDSESEENEIILLSNINVQIQQTQFSLLSFIDKKAGSLHRYMWKDELASVVLMKNSIYNQEEFTAQIGVLKHFINDIDLKVEIDGKILPVERGYAIYKTKNYKIGENEVKGKVKHWNPIKQIEESQDLHFYFQVLKK